jgi:hypothetical protein
MRYEILNDEDPQHPRKEFDVFGTILYTSSRYELGDERVSAEEIQSKTQDTSVIALPVFAFIHGSVTLNTGGFDCPWDSGQCGIIYITKDKVRETFKVKRISTTLLKQVRETLQSEVKTYSQYLSGEVYGYRILNDQNEEVDSCWGFYGLENVEAEAKEALQRALDYIPPSPEALAALNAGIESAKQGKIVFRTENFSQYANDE